MLDKVSAIDRIRLHAVTPPRALDTDAVSQRGMPAVTAASRHAAVVPFSAVPPSEANVSPQDLVYAQLVQGAANGTSEVDVDGDGQTDYWALSRQDLVALGVDAGVVNPGSMIFDWGTYSTVPPSTFDYTVYTDRDGNYVVAFPGHQQWDDTFQYDAQIGDAVALVTGLHAALEGQQGFESMTLAGHSMGGGMASAAAAATGLPAVVFTPHSVSDQALADAGLDPAQARAEAEDLVTGYSMENDNVLNPWWYFPHQGDQVLGDIVELENDADKPHDLSSVIDSLEEGLEAG